MPLGGGTQALFDCVTTVSTLWDTVGLAESSQSAWISGHHRKRCPDPHGRNGAHRSAPGLANRYVCLAAIDALQERSAEIAAAVLLIDIDRFNRVNDRFGHSMGDALIVAVAERIEACSSRAISRPPGRRRICSHCSPLLSAGGGALCRNPGDHRRDLRKIRLPWCDRHQRWACLFGWAAHHRTSAVPAPRCAQPRQPAEAVRGSTTRQCAKRSKAESGSSVTSPTR